MATGVIDDERQNGAEGLDFYFDPIRLAVFVCFVRTIRAGQMDFPESRQLRIFLGGEADLQRQQYYTSQSFPVIEDVLVDQGSSKISLIRILRMKSIDMGRSFGTVVEETMKGCTKELTTD